MHIVNTYELFDNIIAYKVLLIFTEWFSGREASLLYQGKKIENIDIGKNGLKLRKKKTNTHRTVSIYSREFKTLEWLKEEKITKIYYRSSTKGKLHTYSSTRYRMKIFLPKIMEEYIVKYHKIKLNKKEKQALKILFSFESLTEFLIEDCIFYNKIITIGDFLNNILFDFLYISTRKVPKYGKNEMKLCHEIRRILRKKCDEKDIEKINHMIENNDHSYAYFLLYKAMNDVSPKLSEKLINDTLDKNLSRVIKDNLTDLHLNSKLKHISV